MGKKGAPRPGNYSPFRQAASAGKVSRWALLVGAAVIVGAVLLLWFGDEDGTLAELAETPITDTITDAYYVMTERRAMAHQVAACEHDFGGEYMRRWEQGRHDICPPHAGWVRTHTPLGAASKVQCWETESGPLVACLSTNVIVKPLQQWLGRSNVKPLSAKRVRALCKGPNAITQPVLLVERQDTINLYHSMEYFDTIYNTLDLLSARTNVSGPLLVMFTDKQPDGPFHEFWTRLGKVRNLAKNPLPADTCLRTVIHAPPAEHKTSLLTHKGVGPEASATGCTSPQLLGFMNWLRNKLFKELAPTSALDNMRTSPKAVIEATPAKRRPLPNEDLMESDVAVLAAPKPAPPPMLAEGKGRAPGVEVLTVLWVSRARHEMLNELTLSEWQRTRRAYNDVEVVKTLTAEVAIWNNRAATRLVEEGGVSAISTPRVFFDFRALELWDMPWSEQAYTLMRTGVLVGTHGAGLSNQVFMRPGKSAVVEILHNVGTQRHFANVATLVGNRYMVHDSKGSSIADVPGLASRVRQAMDWVAEAYSGKPTFTPPSSSWRQKNPDEEAFDDMLGGNNKDDIFSGTDFF